MIVRAIGGLCNRLRVVLSYRTAYGPIGVVWEPDGEIANGRFSDVFYPLPGVRFYESNPEPSDDIVATCDPCPAGLGMFSDGVRLCHPNMWHEGYRLLELRAAYMARYRALRPPTPYSAIHVRRTDHDAIAACDPTRDEEFLAFIASARDVVYLATDNGTTQLQYMRAIREADRLCVVCDGIHVHERENASGQRNTSLADAAIDLFMCAGAAEFRGTRHSSFSNAVMTLQKLGGWWT